MSRCAYAEGGSRRAGNRMKKAAMKKLGDRREHPRMAIGFNEYFKREVYGKKPSRPSKLRLHHDNSAGLAHY